MDFDFWPKSSRQKVGMAENGQNIDFEAKIMVLSEQGGGPPTENFFYIIVVEGNQGYQMLFTRSKNIDPSRIYRIFKIAKHIQLPCGRTLYSRLSQNFKF